LIDHPGESEVRGIMFGLTQEPNNIKSFDGSEMESCGKKKIKKKIKTFGSK
jgi:hypothetical protein